MQTLLLIDDDEELAPPLARYLQRFDFALAHAARPSLGLARLAEGDVAAVILDVMLPEMDGFELCRRIRRDPALAMLPVLMLTARGDLTDRVVGLELGADDYLPKPFEPRELAARLQAILRRRGAAQATPAATLVINDWQAMPATSTPGAAGQEVLRFEGLRIDLRRREVHQTQGEGAAASQAAVDLTGAEFELLVLLARDPGRVFSRDEILSQLRGQEADLFTRAVDILVSRLRRKLQPLALIKTLRNAGYTFAGVPLR
jgi:two-component system, OmpR family, response regulator